MMNVKSSERSVTSSFMPTSSSSSSSMYVHPSPIYENSRITCWLIHLPTPKKKNDTFLSYEYHTFLLGSY